MKILSGIATVLGPNKADTPVKSTKDVSEQQIQFLSRKQQQQQFPEFSIESIQVCLALRKKLEIGH